MNILKYKLLVICVPAVLLAGHAGYAVAQQRANYRLAERFRRLDQSPIMKYSTEVKPTFINKTDCFWYAFTNREGRKYWYVNPHTRTRKPLFDTDELLSRVAEFTHKTYPKAKDYLNFTFEKDNETLKLDIDGGTFYYNIKTKKLTKKEGKTRYPQPDPYWKKYSTDSLYMLYASRNNLFCVGNAAKGQDSIPFQMTRDGEENYSFNREDEGRYNDRFGAEGAEWIPGTHRFYALREDNRLLHDLGLVNATTKEPELEMYKAELAGDKHVTQYELLLGDADTRKVQKLDINRWQDQYVEVLYASKDGQRLYFQRWNRPWNQSDICEIDVKTGNIRTVIHEEDKPYLDYQMRSISFLNDAKEILFRSERTGWGHYYLYDTATGKLKQQITDGTWVAGPIAKIDTVGRKMYFYGYGREKGIDPHYYVLYEADMNKCNALRKLTPENASHEVTISPSGRYMVDSYSTVSMIPVNVVRNRRGKIIMRLDSTDVLETVRPLGWRMPERFCVKAADGVTDLYGVMWKPADFDPQKKYPIISHVYPGPFFEYVPTRFTLNDDYNTRLAQLGFIVISVGHRGGTPMRGKAYHTYGYGNMRDYPLADDKYAIEQLAERYPFININKVGIYGHSGGGFMSAAAICTYPDFYKAAVAAAGNYDNRIFNKGFVEIHYGVNEKKTVEKDSLGTEKTTYEYSVDVHPVQELVKNYKGGLLLFTGAMDKTVNPANTFRLVNSLIKANKDFDMIVLPKATHGFFNESGTFFEHKMWRHFARLLLDDNSADFDIDMNRYMIKDSDKRK